MFSGESNAQQRRGGDVWQRRRCLAEEAMFGRGGDV